MKNLPQKETIMLEFGITHNDLLTRPEHVYEKLFCASCLRAGTDVTAKVLERYGELRNALFPVKVEPEQAKE